MERTVCEFLGLSLVALAAFGVSKYFKLKAVFEGTNISTSSFGSLLNSENTVLMETIYFVAIPVVVYSAFRLYFGIMIFLSNKLNNLFPVKAQNTGKKK